jgi:diguanylate cyclase (GGDEF)-like protein
MDVARAEQTPLSVAILDADHFKQVNDTWGHGVGDQVLQGVARALTAAVRDGDVVARYGGEEFVVLLPGVGGAAAAERGESIREAVEADALRLGGAAGPTRVTVSVGVASFPADAAGLDALLQAADHALYEAKRGGRNRVERYRRA